MNGKALVSASPATVRVCQSHQYPEPLVPRRAEPGALHSGALTAGSKLHTACSNLLRYLAVSKKSKACWITEAAFSDR
jgi:hypothetical protein